MKRKSSSREHDAKYFINSLRNRGEKFRVLQKRKTFQVFRSVGGSAAPYFFKEPPENSAFLLLDQRHRRLANSVFIRTAKEFNKYIVKNGFYVKQVTPNHKSTLRDDDLWDKSVKKGDVIYYIDVNNCYWDIAHKKLKYISKSLYNQYVDNDTLKQFRNQSLAMQTSTQTMFFYENGLEYWRITEDKSLHEKMYTNIRTTAWNVIGSAYDIASSYGDGLFYRTDGIMVFKPEVVSILVEYFNHEGFSVKIKKYRKMNRFYMTDASTGEVKKF